MRLVLLRFLGLGFVALPQRSAVTRPLDIVRANDNRVAGGTLRGGVLTLDLEAREALWRPDGDHGPALALAMFGEVGHATQNPGPMIRVPTGSRIRASVHNALRDSTLIVYGLHSHPGALDDTIQIAPGVTRRVTFMAGAPGTYFYWATTTHHAVADRAGYDSQLHGAFIVDPPGARPNDRVFVLGDWIAAGDPDIAPQLRVINGLSWPNTERFSYTVGDTVRWRWINPSDSPHPMHLHGFYFDVTSRGSYAVDTIFGAGDRPRVVTEMPLPGGTFAMQWVPDEPGHWLFHCHVAFHTSMFLSPEIIPDPVDPIALNSMDNMAASMRGMVLSVNVAPGRSTARRPAIVSGARSIRLIAQEARGRFDKLDALAFVRQDGAIPPAADSVPSPSSMLVLNRGEPVRITIVNRSRAPTGVHWHGIEVPAYSDGVPGMSGMDGRMAPMIAPGDSFVAAFTPLRSGTFMYHAHANETFQIGLGMYGALLVVDPARYDPAHERIIILGGNGPSGRPARINGQLVPDTIRLKAGETYRLRIIDIISDWTSKIALTREDTLVHWKALAKDGAELPVRAQLARRAELISGPGQTMDFEYRPLAPGMMRLDVAQRTGAWKTHVDIEVRP